MALSLHREISPWIQIRPDNWRKEASKKNSARRMVERRVTEYEAEARATREKTARLKALRLAREAEIVIAL